MRVRQSFTRRVPHVRFPNRVSVRHSAAGQVMIIFALASLVLVGFVALSVDTGFLMAERRQTQSAADAAALAGAKALFDGDTGQIVSSAEAYGAENADVPVGDVTVSWPPATGTYADNLEYVQVTITKEVDKFFVGALYSGTWQVEASAVAGVELLGANYALITLEKTESPGIYMNGNTRLNLTGDQASAYGSTNVQGNGQLNVTGSVDSHGTVTGVGSAPNGINQNMPYIPDPMEGVPPPTDKGETRSGCDGNCDLLPGHYKDQTINCKTVCNFAPGPYYFEDTTVKSQNTNSQMNGPGGVFFYFTGDSMFDSKNGAVNLRAPSVSPYSGGRDGVVFWFATCNKTIDFQGNGNFYLHGVVYMPCSMAWMHGTPGGTGVRGQWIVDRLDVRGNSNFTINYHEYIETTRPKIFLVD